MELDTMYAPQLTDRFSDEALAKTAPDDIKRTISAIHKSIPIHARAMADAKPAIVADTTKTESGRRVSYEQLFAENVAKPIQEADKPLGLIGLHVGEGSAALLKQAVAKHTVSEGRMLAIAGVLARLDPDVQTRTVNSKIADRDDSETLATLVSAPAIFAVASPSQRERAAAALMELHDPERAAELNDLKLAIQACREGFESLARFGRDKFGLTPLPAKAA